MKKKMPNRKEFEHYCGQWNKDISWMKNAA